MNKILTALLSVLVLVANGIARDPWQEGIRELKPSIAGDNDPAYHDDMKLPLGPKAGRDLIINDNNGNYLHINNCSNIANEEGTNFKTGVFVPYQLEERYVENDEKMNDLYLYNNHHSVIHYVLTYAVTCGNQITYAGAVHWQWDIHQCRQGCITKTYDKDGYHDVDLSTYDPTNFTFITNNQDVMKAGKNYIPVDQIFNAWNAREVELPLFTGGNNKMDVPVLMVPGIRSDYSDTWGITVVDTDKESSAFRAGLVTGYEEGTFPYIMARYMGLDMSPEGINKNGIYFFNAPVKKISNDEYIQPPPMWVDENIPASISFALYKKLEETLDDFYNDEWKTNDKLMIDIVAHSQGGLVVREMLRAMKAGECSSCKQGSLNPANHIRKLVTINTPHKGTPVTTPVEDLKNNPKYYSIARIAEDVEDQVKLEKEHPVPTKEEYLPECIEKYAYLIPYPDVDVPALCEQEWDTKGVPNSSKELVSADVSLHLDRLYDEVEESVWGKTYSINERLFTMINPFYQTGTAIGYIIGLNTDVTMRVRGNILGDYEIQTKTVKPIIGTRHENDTISSSMLRYIRYYISDGREQGAPLGLTSNFIENLKEYPQLPNGKNLELQPLYSYNLSGFKNYILDQFQQGATSICTDKDEQQQCFNVTTLFSEYLRLNQRVTVDKESIKSLAETAEAIDLFTKQWLSRSDLLVPVESQTYGYDVDEKGNLIGDPWKGIPEFHKPRTYNIYFSTVPDVAPMNMVAHGPVSTETSKRIDLGNIHKTIGIAQLPSATYMGMDILCALRTDVCPADMDENYFLKIPELISRGSVKTLDGTDKVVTKQELDLTGDFTIKPVYQSSNFQGVGVAQNGETIIVAAFDIEKGTYVWYKDASGNEQVKVISEDTNVRWQVNISRKDNAILVIATSNDGRKEEFSVPVNLTSNSITLEVYGDEDASSSVVFLGGTGIATDPSTQARPTVATSREEQMTGDIAVLHSEIGQSEKNTSRPKIIVVNAGDKALNGFKVAYYFTADPALSPEVEMDYPKHPVNVEHLGGDQWRFVIDQSNVTLAAGGRIPDVNGYQIRLHYHDWSEWNHFNDYSAKQSIGFLKLNDQIVVYDTEGNILWGVPPTLPREQTTLPKRSVELTWVDAGAHELNHLKPEFTITNTGNTSLQNFKVRFYLRAPEGISFEDLAIWENTEAEPTISAIAPNIWMVEVNFNKHILYAGKQTFGGKFGIHLTNWNPFNKDMLGLVVVDESGEIIWGDPWDGSGVAKQYMISFSK